MSDLERNMPDPENDVLVAEEDLRRALAPLAPEAESFEAGVRERVERGTASSSEDGRSPFAQVRVPAWLRQAAAFLPPTWIARGATGSVLTASKPGLLAKIPLTLALPALAVLAVLGTFFGAVAAGKRAAAEQADEPKVQDARHWFQRKGMWAVHLAGISMLALMWVQPRLVLLVLLGSMVALAWVATQLARFGLWTRTAVGVFAMQMVLPVGMYMIAFQSMATQALPAPRLIGLIIVLGSVCVFLFSMREHMRKSPHREHAILLTLASLVAVPLAIGGRTYGPVRLAEYAEEIDLATSARFETGPVELMDELSLRLGYPPSRDWSEQSDRVVVLMALRAGRVHPMDYPDLFDERRMSSLVSGWPEYPAPLMNAVDAVLLHHTRGMAPEAREATIGTIEHHARKDPAFGEIAKLDRCIALLEELEAPEVIERLRPLVHERLRAHWQGTYDRWGASAGFESYLEAARSARRSLSNPEATTHAVALMRAVGIPEGIDLVRVRRALDRTRRPILPFAGPRHRTVWTGVGLEQLRKLDPTSLQRWKDLLDPVAIAALLLVVLAGVLAALSRRESDSSEVFEMQGSAGRMLWPRER